MILNLRAVARVLPVTTLILAACASDRHRSGKPKSRSRHGCIPLRWARAQLTSTPRPGRREVLPLRFDHGLIFSYAQRRRLSLRDKGQTSWIIANKTAVVSPNSSIPLSASRAPIICHCGSSDTLSWP